MHDALTKAVSSLHKDLWANGRHDTEKSDLGRKPYETVNNIRWCFFLYFARWIFSLLSVIFLFFYLKNIFFPQQLVRGVGEKHYCHNPHSVRWYNIIHRLVLKTTQETCVVWFWNTLADRLLNYIRWKCEDWIYSRPFSDLNPAKPLSCIQHSYRLQLVWGIWKPYLPTFLLNKIGIQ